MRRFVAATVLLGAAVAVWLLWPGRTPPLPRADETTATPAPKSQPSTGTGAAAADGPSATPAAAGVSTISRTAAPYDEADFPLVAPLNAPGSNIARDLDLLRQVFETWRSHFPHDGNPVGENADITAALMGDNRLNLVLIPKGHRAVNENGELCDRWGTPFRFHQLSGSRMEIRSAGPDRKFTTDDDAVWTP